MASLAPYGAEGLDWFAGMTDSGAASLRAAAAGREAKERHETEHGEDYDPEFTPADMAATLLTILGIDPDTPLHTPLGRPVKLADGGKPVREIL